MLLEAIEFCIAMVLITITTLMVTLIICATIKTIKDKEGKKK